MTNTLLSSFRRSALRRGLTWLQSSKRSALPMIAMSICWPLAGAQASPQTAIAATYSKQQLIAIASQMRQEAEKQGKTASDAFERHLDSTTVLAVRTKSGRAELHASSADAFFVVAGHATLVTGGTIVNPQGTEEVRGDSVRGGTRAELRAGDVVHIPADTPHQLLLDGNDSFVYVLIKIMAK
jgi:mannose-6-phosphate isomerase-like protein (cupin superfamily)